MGGKIAKTLNTSNASKCEDVKKMYQNPKGTPLVLACLDGRVDHVKTLIKCQSEMLNELGTNKKGHQYTPLMATIVQGDTHVKGNIDHEQVFKILLDAGANPDIVDDREWNALHYAVRKKKNIFVKLLLTKMKREDINHMDDMNRTPLDICNEKKYTEKGKLILEKLEELKASSSGVTSGTKNITLRF